MRMKTLFYILFLVLAPNLVAARELSKATPEAVGSLVYQSIIQ